ncbi:MAG: hypothetical protein JW818_21760 [Pirellulales bacterium]|nr:hypothetical protein [Pirellulales bacterium]
MRSTSEGNTSGPARASRGLWIWFVGGAVLVFVGMLLFVKIDAMHPSGQYATSYPLWEYYAVMLPLAIRPTPLGPASGSISNSITVLGQHLLLSAIGGCMAIGAGWWCADNVNNRLVGG